jgi:hypothetical protein
MVGTEDFRSGKVALKQAQNKTGAVRVTRERPFIIGAFLASLGSDSGLFYNWRINSGTIGYKDATNNKAIPRLKARTVLG